MRKHLPPVSPFLAALAVSLSLAGQAPADVIYSTLGPGDSYDNRSGAWTESGPDATLAPTWRQAESFRVPVDGDYVFQGARLALGLISGPNEIDLRLYNDAGGRPGTVLETIHASGQMPHLFDFSSGHLVDFESAEQHLLLAGQTYWLLPFASGATDAGWNWNDQLTGQTGPHAQSRELDPTDWDTRTDIRAAFEVNAALVPEPSALTLSALGVAALLGYHWGRRRLDR
jgi:hypothetical protein